MPKYIEGGAFSNDAHVEETHLPEDSNKVIHRHGRHKESVCGGRGDSRESALKLLLFLIICLKIESSPIQPEPIGKVALSTQGSSEPCSHFDKPRHVVVAVNPRSGRKKRDGDKARALSSYRKSHELRE